MHTLFRFAPAMLLMLATASHAINAEYAKKLERSGCTQMTELQGCDINKTQAENAKEKVWVNGKPVKAKRSDGALVFKDKFITYTIQGDRRLKGEDTWYDSDAQTRGPIVAE